MAKSKKTSTKESHVSRVDMDKANVLLSDVEKEEIEKRASDRILEEEKEAAEQLYFEKALKKAKEMRARDTGNPDDYEDISVRIDLPEFAPDIRHDGVIYWHGRTAIVPRIVAASLNDIMARAWEHDADLQGKKWRHAKQRQRGIHASMDGAQYAS